MNKTRGVISSTQVDSQGESLALEALEMIAETINGPIKPRLGLEHDMSLPPLGIINDAEIIEGDNGIHELVASQEYFTDSEETLIGGEKFIIEFFKDKKFSFVESSQDTLEKMEIAADRHNFQSVGDSVRFFNELKGQTKIEFEDKAISRKAQLSDPEFVYRLSETYIYAYWGSKLAKYILKKTGKKVAKKISDDLSEFYDLIKRSAKNAIQYSTPKNRPITHIVEFPAKISVSLIMVGKSPEEIASALEKRRIGNLRNQIEDIIERFGAEKIQFILNDGNRWELNYFLTSDGKSIGAERAHKRRDVVLENMIEKAKKKKKRK